MKIKTAFMLCLYFIPLILMLTGFVATLWSVILIWIIMGFGMSGIGLSVMHDANHGSYSKNQKVNTVLGFVINFIGGYDATWRIQHNVLHHSFTNIHGLDEDLDQKVLCLSPNQDLKMFHKFQAFYAPFLYGLMTIFRYLIKDFQQVIRYNEKNLLLGQGLSLKSAMAHVIFHKVWYLLLTLFLPMYILPLLWWQTLLGFLLMHFISGVILAFIFQSAHVLEETNFFLADETGSVKNNWAIHQLKTTANFANGSTFFSWFIGGLNYQIEHHLFPNICHVHYKPLSSIVKATAKEFNVPYYQHKTFFGALRSHFTLLHHLGNGRFRAA